MPADPLVSACDDRGENARAGQTRVALTAVRSRRLHSSLRRAARTTDGRFDSLGTEASLGAHRRVDGCDARRSLPALRRRRECDARVRRDRSDRHAPDRVHADRAAPRSRVDDLAHTRPRARRHDPHRQPRLRVPGRHRRGVHRHPAARAVRQALPRPAHRCDRGRRRVPPQGGPERGGRPEARCVRAVRGHAARGEDGRSQAAAGPRRVVGRGSRRRRRPASLALGRRVQHGAVRARARGLALDRGLGVRGAAHDRRARRRLAVDRGARGDAIDRRHRQRRDRAVRHRRHARRTDPRLSLVRRRAARGSAGSRGARDLRAVPGRPRLGRRRHRGRRAARTGRHLPARQRRALPQRSRRARVPPRRRGDERRRRAARGDGRRTSTRGGGGARRPARHAPRYRGPRAARARQPDGRARDDARGVDGPSRARRSAGRARRRPARRLPPAPDRHLRIHGRLGPRRGGRGSRRRRHARRHHVVPHEARGDAHRRGPAHDDGQGERTAAVLERRREPRRGSHPRRRRRDRPAHAQRREPWHLGPHRRRTRARTGRSRDDRRARSGRGHAPCPRAPHPPRSAREGAAPAEGDRIGGGADGDAAVAARARHRDRARGAARPRHARHLAAARRALARRVPVQRHRGAGIRGRRSRTAADRAGRTRMVARAPRVGGTPDRDARTPASASRSPAPRR